MKSVASVIAVLFVLALSYTLIPLPQPLFQNDYSAVVLDQSGKPLRVFLNKSEQWILPPSEQSIPPKLESSVLHYEDRYFYRHPGINPGSLLRALYQNVTSGKIVSGASTITMQVARLMAPKPRTYGNKLLEMLQAIKIEMRYSKEEILRLYLNHAPYGGNIIGYRTACLRYFQKTPQSLSWAEAAALAVLPNAPGLIAPDANASALKQKRNRLLRFLNEDGIIDSLTRRLACREPLPDREYPFPFMAPHLSRSLKQQYPNKQVLSTTIDRALQRTLGRITDNHMERLLVGGIQNAAVLLVDNASGAVRAYLGSHDYDDREHQGRVDGVRASRSSGSILKPFLYALAMDVGQALPNTLIQDIPTQIHGFSPSNADEQYRGIITAHKALVHSYNVPAVRLLNQYGLFDFYYFLQKAGVSTLFRSPESYGLPLILGGAEVSLREMAMMYRGLAEGGVFQNLHILKKRERTPGKNPSQLISKGASWLILNVLNDVHRPGADFYWRRFRDQWPLAWKTGTSYGQRDAWAVGVNPQWTIAVWVGNFNGEANTNLSGARSAGPLLFDIFNVLPKDPGRRWFSEPSDELKTIRLCARSGFVANEHCPETVDVPAPAGMKTMQRCPYHRQIYVAEGDNEEVCSLCWEAGRYRSEVRYILPAAVQQFLHERRKAASQLPSHRSNCPGHQIRPALRILYPEADTRLWIPRDYDGQLQKVTVRAAHQQEDQALYWYLDDHYMGSSRGRHALALEIRKGWHTLEVIDGQGRSRIVRFYAAIMEH